MLGLSGTLSQWVFDRSSQDPGLISVVISGPGEHEAMTNEQLIQHVERDLHKVLSNIPTSATDALLFEKNEPLSRPHHWFMRHALATKRKSMDSFLLVTLSKMTIPPR
jgi:hypothetical protein